MKKYLGLLFFVLLFTLAACSSKSEAPVMKAAIAAAEPVTSAAPTQAPYINNELGFSFAIPDSWETENYTPQVTSKTVEENGEKAKITEVDFVFQGDTENPLLTIQIVPKEWMNDAADKKAESAAQEAQEDYLGTSGELAYRYSLPQACPYDVGPKADLYNSMVLLREDVPNRFKILGGDSQETNSSEVLAAPSIIPIK